MCLIIEDSCWVVHVPFVRMVKFKFLVQFPVGEFFTVGLAVGQSLKFE